MLRASLVLYLALLFATLCAATTAESGTPNVALAVRQTQSRCEGDQILHEVDQALTAVLPILSPILAAIGIPDVSPFVHMILQLLESLHAFC
ncbi:hypothetical protein MOBT1_001246 [Malassezia obtusa]|uniref:Uncharacterized protein n=1 Tax=Malassezia obtusa TaxID=76774 RepID=A0AAF0E2W9_9BASI|nr:hypothetical protein MOBT1_001246 [Malassezia obtusa]